MNLSTTNATDVIYQLAGIQPGSHLAELRARLDEAGDNPRTLLNMRRRLSRIRVFDPANHEEAPPDASGQLLNLARYDRRWVRIKRPSIIVGGEFVVAACRFREPAGEQRLDLRAGIGAGRALRRQ